MTDINESNVAANESETTSEALLAPVGRRGFLKWSAAGVGAAALFPAPLGGADLGPGVARLPVAGGGGAAVDEGAA